MVCGVWCTICACGYVLGNLLGPLSNLDDGEVGCVGRREGCFDLWHGGSDVGAPRLVGCRVFGGDEDEIEGCGVVGEGKLRC